MTRANNRKLRLLIAGGGTGGHVQPAVAVLQELRIREIDVDALWIGSRGGKEREAAAAEGVSFRAVNTGKLRRYRSWRTPFDAALVVAGVMEAYPLIRRFRPDVVFGTGGYVSSAGVFAGFRQAPVLIHEQTSQLGFATRLNRHVADVLALSFPASVAQTAGYKCLVLVTGNPVRATLLNGSRQQGFAQFGFDEALPLVYVTGGARGASPLNQRLEKILPELLESAQVVHQTGPPSANDDLARLTALRSRLPDRLRHRYDVREYTGLELADIYAATALVVARSGAGTVTELAALGLPSLLIPLPGTSGNEQASNARYLEDANAAVVIAQEDATPERLQTEILSLLSDADRRDELAKSARQLGQLGATAALTDALLTLADNNQRS